MPVISRGHNVAVLVAPIPRVLAPLVTAVPRRPVLILASSADRALDIAFRNGPPMTAAAPGRSRGPLPGEHDLVVAGAADALELLEGSALAASAFGCLLLAWPEELDEEGRSALEAVIAEADRDAQRLIVTSVQGAATMALVERYAFKAMTFGIETDARDAPPGPVGPARYLLTGEAAVERALLLARSMVEPGTAVSACPADRREAAGLAGAEPPVLALTPEQLPWARSLFRPLEPLPQETHQPALRRRVESWRRRLETVIQAEDLDRELLLLGPLLARHDPALVAAAALLLARRSAGTEARGAAPAPPPEAAATPPATRIWVGIGHKDGARPGDLVGALAREVGIPGDSIGRIEVRELYTLVDIGAEHAERAARGLAGLTVRGRRLSARVDRGNKAQERRTPRRRGAP